MGLAKALGLRSHDLVLYLFGHLGTIVALPNVNISIRFILVTGLH